MLRNTNFFKTTNLSKDRVDDLHRNKYDISTTSNIIKEYKKKISNIKYINSDIKNNKANSLYNRNKTFYQKKETLTSGITSNNKKFYKKARINTKDENNNNTKKNDNLTSNNQNNKLTKTSNNFYNYDTDHSSMETIKKILYSTDSKKELNKDNNLLKSSQLNDFQKLKGIFNNKININKKDNSPLTLDKNNINNKNNLGNYAYIKKSNQKSENKNIDKDILNKINKELTFNTKTKKTPLKSMKYLSNNNYDYDLDNIDNSLNLSEEFKNIINEKEIIKTNNIYNNNNNNYKVRKIHNNINININNNKNIEHKNNNNRYNNNIDIDSNFLNISDNENENDNDNDDYNMEKNDDIFYLKEKIKELTEEINNKNILINEYSNLAKKSKIKFEQLIIHHKNNMEQVQKDIKKQTMLYKTKIMNAEKEKQKILNKYMENKKYTEFLEVLLFNQKNNNEISESSEGNEDLGFHHETKKIKNFEEIVKKLMNDIAVMKVELENKNNENEKLKNIIIKYKDNRNYRAISNPRKSINITEQMNSVQSRTKNDSKIKNGQKSLNLKKNFNFIKNSNMNNKVIENE